MLSCLGAQAVCIVVFAVPDFNRQVSLLILEGPDTGVSFDVPSRFRLTKEVESEGLEFLVRPSISKLAIV